MYMNRTEAVGQYSCVSFSPAWDSNAKVACKRFMDIIVSATAMIILSPLYLALAIAVKLSSPGHVFYPWRVVGKNGRPFIGYKFRSMVANADRLRSKLEPFNEMRGPVFKITNDARVTKVGTWMRRYSLDELPQLYSVLKVDMSLVGPRPPLVTNYALFTDHRTQNIAVHPGLT